MEFGEVVRRRRMVRAFTDEAVDPAVVRRLLSAANRAPSAGFSQGYALLALEDTEARGRFWRVIGHNPTEQQAVTNAPLIVVPLANKSAYLDRYARPDKGWIDRDEARWPVPYWYIDTGFTALLMLLGAVDESLGAVFFGIMPHAIDAFRAEFGVPAEYTPIGAVAIGHPDTAADTGPSSARKIGRRSLDDVVHHERW